MWFILLVSDKGTFWSKFLVEKFMICSTRHNEGEANLKGTSGCLWPKATVKSPVGACNLRPLFFIFFIFYSLFFTALDALPYPCPALAPTLP